MDIEEELRELIDTFVRIRKEQGITQKKLSEISGVKQSIISKIETMEICPRIDIFITLLHSMEYTLEIAKK